MAEIASHRSTHDLELQFLISKIKQDQVDDDENNDWFPTTYSYFKGEGGRENKTDLEPLQEIRRRVTAGVRHYALTVTAGERSSLALANSH